MSSHAYCRHRRIRWLPLVTFAAAVLALTAATGVRIGTTVGSMDALNRACTVEPR